MKVSYVLFSILVITFFLMQISTAIAKDEPNLAESKFVEATLEHIKYDEIQGMVKSGSTVTLSVLLTNFSKEIESSYLILNSNLKEPTPGISIDGVSEKISIDSPFLIKHGKVGEARITLVGKAPEVNKRENITLLNITQEIKEKYLVLEVKNDVTSELIEEAISEMHDAKEEIEEANWKIANATGTIDASDAKISLGRAELHLEKAWSAYNEEKPKESLEAAKNASYFAMRAEEKAKTAVESTKLRNYGIISAVIGVAIFAFLLLYVRRRREQRKL